MISDIGTVGDDTALLCHTNHPANITTNNGRMHSGGQWFKPDGTEVIYFTISEGFNRNRDPMVVRLYRNTGTTAVDLEGIYRCAINDTNILQTVYVGLYNDDGGGNVQFVCSSIMEV